MDSRERFDWVDFYKELAYKLLEYKSDRKTLVEKVKRLYEITKLSLPTLERDNQIVDIDPFTFIGLFNRSSRTEENRKAILRAIVELFALHSPVPTSFAGVPLLNNQNATFYYFVGDRGASDIDELWELFECSLAYAEHPTSSNRERFCTYFDLAIQKKGNGTAKVTMGLYWVAPEIFLNLDGRNGWYLYKSGKLPEAFVATLPKLKFSGDQISEKISAETYFEISEKVSAFLKSSESTLKDFKALSFEAWRSSTEANQQRRFDAITHEEDDQPVVNDSGAIELGQTRYWIYSPGENASLWDEFYRAGVMAIGWGKIGDLRTFSTKEAMRLKIAECFDSESSHRNDAHATWQFLNEMKPGDVIFVKKGKKIVLGQGVVTSDYRFEASRKDDYKHVRSVRWTHRGEWAYPELAPNKVLTDITPYPEMIQKLNVLFDDGVSAFETYTKGDFLAEVYMSEASYGTLTHLLKYKKNVILQGAPGVGKTFVAKRLAESIMGVKDASRIAMVQFHQSYSYEDFIMGFRPTANGFELKEGPFYRFCKRAQKDKENAYFFIIDEINRGNLSKIFGELFMLLENDKRGLEVTLLYSDEQFSVPENVYIIGMMNTADRSLAMLDYALRRRFAFFEMAPAFQTEGFQTYYKGKKSPKLNKLIAAVESLNGEIEADETLGRGFQIGHSYFCTEDEIDATWLENVVTYELLPLLNEYWFDERSKVRDWEARLKEAIR